jgi:cytochrome c556
MMKKIVGAGLAVVAAASLWGAPAKADGINPIAVRQAGMSLLSGDLGLIKTVVEAKGDVTKLAGAGGAIVKFAAVIPSLYGPGTDKGGETKALPEVWSDAAGYQKAAAALGAAAATFVTAAKAGDADAAAAGFKAIADSCGGCHRAYRAK